MLERERERFDRLIAEVAEGTRNQEHFEELADRGIRIGGAICTAFRGEPRPVNPPLLVTANGAWF